MKRGWRGDRGVRNLDEATLAQQAPPAVHVLDDADGLSLCGAPSSPGDLTRQALRTIQRRPSICAACDDVIWGTRARGVRP